MVVDPLPTAMNVNCRSGPEPLTPAAPGSTADLDGGLAGIVANIQRGRIDVAVLREQRAGVA